MASDFFGLDIGTHSIKMVQLKRENKRYILQAFGKAETPPNALTSDSPDDQAALANALRSLVKDSHITTSNVSTAFPESVIFTRVIEMPVMGDKELATAIQYEAEQYIPLPLKDVKLSHQILNRPDSKDKEAKMSVFLVAAPVNLIQRYLGFLSAAKLQPVSFETETLAIKRALVEGRDPGPTTLLISIGATTTDLSIVSGGIISFTRSIATGGTALARAIAQDLGFEMGQAEEYKKNYGLMEDQLEGKILQAIKPVFDIITSEIERAILFYQAKHPSDPIKRVVLVGGTANLPGMVVYLATTIGLEVQIGNPWQNVEVPAALQQRIKEEETSYAVAVGLAMKDG
jgi:type IV pilus assembly protein PilM